MRVQRQHLHNGPCFIANNVIGETHYSSYLEMCINIERIITSNQRYLTNRDPFYWHGLNLIPVLISNHMPIPMKCWWNYL